MIACPDGTWTQMPGATTVEECCEYPLQLLPAHLWLSYVPERALVTGGLRQ